MANEPNPKSFRFSDEELQLLEAAKDRHGSYKAALIAGLRLDAGQEQPDWPAQLRRLAQELEDK